MKTYESVVRGEEEYLTIENTIIPRSNTLYVQALAEVEAGDAEILPYTKPAPTKVELDAPHLATLAGTDWYVVRAFETGVPVPQHILDARESARRSI